MKNKTFSINGKVYTSKEIDTKALIVFEDCGLTLFDMGNIDKKTFSFVTAYIAFCGNLSPDKSADELNEHLINGGNIDEVITVFAEALTDSRFFQAIAKNGEEKTPTTTKKK